MSLRRLSLPAAAYKPNSVPSDPLLLSPDIELDDDDDQGHSLPGSVYGYGSNRGQNDRDVLSNMHKEAGKIRWTYFLLGNAMLLPWNAFMTATPYFLSRLAGSSLRSTFSSYMSTTYTAAKFIFLAHATATSKQIPPSRSTIFTLSGISILTLLLALSTFLHVPQGLFFAFVLANGVAQASLDSYLQTSVTAVASLFGPSAIQAMMSGQAVVSVVISAVQVVSACTVVWGGSASANDAEEDDRAAEESAFIFFGLSTVFLWVSIVAQRWLMALPAYKEVAGPLERATRAESPAERRRLVSSSPVMRHSREVSSASVFESDRVIPVAKANVVYELAVAYVYVVTMAVFPPITTSVQPVNPDFHPLIFTSVHFLVFGVGDFLGRYILSFPSLVVWSSRKLLSLSALRTLFIPVFLMCNVSLPSTGTPVVGPTINSDLLFMLIILLFGISNGYISSLCIMSACSLEHNPKLDGRRDDVDVAATVASFCMVGGLALGSIASFLVRWSICQCNPFSQ